VSSLKEICGEITEDNYLLRGMDGRNKECQRNPTGHEPIIAEEMTEDNNNFLLISIVNYFDIIIS
jgi:hypothetical protein